MRGLKLRLYRFRVRFQAEPLDHAVLVCAALAPNSLILVMDELFAQRCSCQIFIFGSLTGHLGRSEISVQQVRRALSNYVAYRTVKKVK